MISSTSSSVTDKEQVLIPNIYFVISHGILVCIMYICCMYVRFCTCDYIDVGWRTALELCKYKSLGGCLILLFILVIGYETYFFFQYVFFWNRVVTWVRRNQFDSGLEKALHRFGLGSLVIGMLLIWDKKI